LTDPEVCAAIVARWCPSRQRQAQIGSPPTDRMAALIAFSTLPVFLIILIPA
jgi:hypothetical protein